MYIIQKMEVSAAIITDGKKVLCFRKGESSHTYLAHRFEFPGGKIEPGELPEQALVRELEEELRYRTMSESLEFFEDIDYDYEDFSVRLHYFVIRDQYPSFVLTEHTEAKWVAIDDLLDLDWAGADLKLVKTLQERVRKSGGGL